MDMEIKLNIKNEHLFRFLDFLFEKQDGKFIVSQNKDFGRLLCSYFKRSEFPVPFVEEKHCATFILPKTNHIERIAEKYYLYFDKFDIHRLNMALKAESDIDFKLYYVNGRFQGFRQKDIIEAYINSRRLLFGLDLHETIKKRTYREEEKNLQIIRKILQDKCELINKNIAKQINTDINNLISNS